MELKTTMRFSLTRSISGWTNVSMQDSLQKK